MDTALGYGDNITAYGPYGRLSQYLETETTFVPKPTFKCSNKNDAFTVKYIKIGNGKLKQKVGLITLDEFSVAGNIHFNGNNSSYNKYSYIYKGSRYWTMSPYVYVFANDVVSNVRMSIVHDNGCIAYSSVNENSTLSSGSSVVPVINLSPKTVLKLEGT